MNEVDLNLANPNSSIQCLLNDPVFQKEAKKIVIEMLKVHGGSPERKIHKMINCFFRRVGQYNSSLPQDKQLDLNDPLSQKIYVRAVLLLHGKKVPDLLIKMEKLYLSNPLLANKPAQQEGNNGQVHFFQAEFLRDALEYCAGVDPVKLANRHSKSEKRLPSRENEVEMAEMAENTLRKDYRAKLMRNLENEYQMHQKQRGEIGDSSIVCKLIEDEEFVQDVKAFLSDFTRQNNWRGKYTIMHQFGRGIDVLYKKHQKKISEKNMEVGSDQIALFYSALVIAGRRFVPELFEIIGPNYETYSSLIQNDRDFQMMQIFQVKDYFEQWEEIHSSFQTGE